MIHAEKQIDDALEATRPAVAPIRQPPGAAGNRPVRLGVGDRAAELIKADGHRKPQV